MRSLVTYCLGIYGACDTSVERWQNRKLKVSSLASLQKTEKTLFLILCSLSLKQLTVAASLFCLDYDCKFISTLFQDQSGKELQLGVTSTGLVIFQNSVKINTFSWCKIVKISFKQKQFFVQLKREPVCFFFRFPNVLQGVFNMFKIFFFQSDVFMQNKTRWNAICKYFKRKNLQFLQAEVPSSI